MGLVEREQHERVAVLALNRPERRNALSGELIDALIDALRTADADEDTGAIVVTGRGTVFCAGGDLAGGLGSADGVLAAHQGRGRFGEALALIPSLGTPVIAALNGDAMGGGLGLAAGCDLIVADPSARLGTPEIKLGLFPHVILAVLQRNVPRKVLMEMVLTGARLSAEEGRAIGLVNRISEEGEVMEAALALAAEIAAKSPAVVALGKQGFHHIADQSFDDALEYMNGQLTLNLLTEDAMEGIAAFMQKRPPQWKGR